VVIADESEKVGDVGRMVQGRQRRFPVAGSRHWNGRSQKSGEKRGKIRSSLFHVSLHLVEMKLRSPCHKTKRAFESDVTPDESFWLRELTSAHGLQTFHCSRQYLSVLMHGRP